MHGLKVMERGFVHACWKVLLLHFHAWGALRLVSTAPIGSSSSPATEMGQIQEVQDAIFPVIAQ